MDLDTMLLDRVFQPVVDEVADTASNFALARASLVGAIVLYTVVLAWNLSVANSPFGIALAIGAALVTYSGAQQMRSQITLAERQSRPGLMNVRRVTMRLFRAAFLSVMFGSGLLVLLPGADMACVCVFAGNLLWLATGYFISCSSAAPTQSFRRRSPAFAGAT